MKQKTVETTENGSEERMQRGVVAGLILSLALSLGAIGVGKLCSAPDRKKHTEALAKAVKDKVEVALKVQKDTDEIIDRKELEQRAQKEIHELSVQLDCSLGRCAKSISGEHALILASVLLHNPSGAKIHEATKNFPEEIQGEMCCIARILGEQPHLAKTVLGSLKSCLKKEGGGRELARHVIPDENAILNNPNAVRLLTNQYLLSRVGHENAPEEQISLSEKK